MNYIRHLFFLVMFFFPNALPSQTPINNGTEIGIKDYKITTTQFAEYPDLCVGKDEIVWIVYTSYNEGKETIQLSKFEKDTVSLTLEVNSTKGFEYIPRICCDKNNRLWIAWSAKRNDNWDIYLRSFSDGIFSEEIRITTDENVDIHPAIAIDHNNNVWLVWERIFNTYTEIVCAVIAKDSIISRWIINESNDINLRPTILSSPTSIFVAWDRQLNGSYQVLMREFKNRKWKKTFEVSEANGFNMSPSLAVDKNNQLLIAYHSNVQPNGIIGFSSWIYLVRLNDKYQKEIITTATNGDWQKNGEDQGLEFPSILPDKRGTVWISAHSSQAFYIQGIKGSNHTPLNKCSLDGWGGRGQHMRTVLAPNGLIYSIRRDINYIYLSYFNPADSKITFKDSNIIIKKFTAITQKSDSDKRKFKLTLPENLQIYFGDIHQHSSLSDGCGTVDQCYTRSRYVFQYDFAALTDHDWFTGNLLLPSEWEWIKIVGQLYDQSGNFVTIPAYEWTTLRIPRGYGHKNIYFADWSQPLLPSFEIAPSTKELIEKLKPLKAIAIPHHIGWTGVDWENFDSELSPCIEIVSAHGAFEYMGNEPITHRGGMSGYFIQDGLTNGMRFGFTGSSDGHGLRYHHGIARKENEWQTGLTAVLATELTRESVLDALKKRRVYATSGVPVKILFSINNTLMGGEVQTASKPEITFDVAGTAPLKYIILIRNNENIQYFGKDIRNGYGIRKTFIDETPKPGKYWYYIRVIQENGEMAWSSPIWVEYLGK